VSGHADRDEVPAAALLAQIDGGAAPIILDVRSGAEFRAGHVPGALHVPFWKVRVRVRSIPAASDDPVVVYCGHGPRAWFAGAVLRKCGFQRVSYLEGHFSRWRAAGLREDR
jgi:hydroxyacylglutathione hydrolase